MLAAARALTLRGRLALVVDLEENVPMLMLLLISCLASPGTAQVRAGAGTAGVNFGAGGCRSSRGKDCVSSEAEVPLRGVHGRTYRATRAIVRSQAGGAC